MVTDTTTCHNCKAPQCEWTGVRCSKGKDCREVFCFTCLSKSYPVLYGSIFRSICWTCPACLEACTCDGCSDPLKRQERQQIACAKYQEEQEFIAAHQAEIKQAALASKEAKLVQPIPIKEPSRREMMLEDGENSWPCPRCSVINTADEVECNACCFHRKRSTRKRTVYSEPAHYEEKFHVQKPTPKRAREVCYDESSPPQKGRVSALRQLVKKPWADGWDCARKLALDLVEEARQQAIKQDIPVSQVRQLPTKYQLANTRATHVRKWFDREPTLAKKFMRAAGLVKTKSNGTFLKQSIGSLDDLPAIIKSVDLSRYDPGTSLSGDDADEPIGVHHGVDIAESPCPSPSPFSSSPSSPLSATEQPKLKVYYHQSDDKQPFVFKVPITDLKTIDELQDRLTMLLREMGQPVDVTKKPLILTEGGSASYLTENTPCTSIDDLSRCSLIHVRVQ